MIYFSYIGIGAVLLAVIFLLYQMYLSRSDYFFWSLIFIVGVGVSFGIGKYITDILK